LKATVSSFFSPRNSRELAYAVLRSVAAGEGFADERFDALLGQDEFSPADRGLARELIATVIRREMTLDTLLDPCVRRGKGHVEPELWTILQLGAAQIVLLGGIAQHAAVHETVNLSKRVGRSGWSGFVNGVLRGVTRMMTEEDGTTAGRSAVPLSPGRYRVLNQPLFPDPETKPADYFSQGFSFPLWLAERWSQRFTAEQLFALGFWWNSPAPMTLRVNLLRNSTAEYQASLAAAGIASHPGAFPETLCLESTRAVHQLPGFDDGLVTVQDESAQYPARWLAPQPGDSVWDLCAAPGGKSTHLAELMRDQGLIYATDTQEHRLGRILENAQRLGLKTVRTALLERDLGELPRREFAAALVDVPCSNTGVLGKRPEARWRLAPHDLVELPQLQHKILRTALSRVKAGGRAVYSTCSIEPEENGAVVRQVLAGQRGWTLVREQEHLPGQPGDGGYVALLQHHPGEPTAG